jgi:hypothetical protein
MNHVVYFIELCPLAESGSERIGPRLAIRGCWEQAAAGPLTGPVYPLGCFGLKDYPQPRLAGLLVGYINRVMHKEPLLSCFYAQQYDALGCSWAR